MPHTAKNHAAQQGFTLLELSIVLTILGLLVGGVLAGRELIRSAEIQGTISDIEQVRTAYTHFFGKYGCVPGDCDKQEQYFDLTNGDGNGIIECGNSPPWCPAPIQEQSVAFMAMKMAGLTRSGAETADGFEPTDLRDCQLFIHGEWEDENDWDFYSAPTGNYMQITQNLNEAPWHTDCMTPEEAWKIDKALDDGYAASGRILGKSTSADYSECASEPYDEGEKYRATYNVQNEAVVCTLYVRLD